MIYFDNSASSPMTKEVREVFFRETAFFANPSSLHRLGFEAEKRMEAAREQVARAIGAEPEEIIFTSGGTEADNIALFGAAKKLRRQGNRILSTNSEHPAVEECLKELEAEGFEIVRLSTKGGALDLREVEDAANEKTILAAVMHTNNETGAVYDVAGVGRIVKQKNPRALVFSDAVQALFKSPLDVRLLGVDLMSLSGHKICGPKGIGALYIKKGLGILPRVFGGGQEKGIRSGTENLPGIVAMGEACRLGKAQEAEGIAKMAEVREEILSALSSDPRISFHLPAKASSHILSLQAQGFPSEGLLHMLSEKGVFVSSGSACSSHKGRSAVLKNFGLRREEEERTVRLSFSPMNTVQEAREFVTILKEILR